MKSCIGIDPGWASFAITVRAMDEDPLAKVKESSLFLCPKDLPSIKDLFYQIERGLPPYFKIAEDVYIERFAAYEDVHSPVSEQVNRIIGALEFYFSYIYQANVHLVRAIEWKPALCKYLVRTKSFTNPSTKFDKKFSMAAAKSVSLSKQPILNDHIADSICLSSMKLVDIYNEELNSRRTGTRSP